MVILWLEMANSPLVTENHPERGLGLMYKGFFGNKGQLAESRQATQHISVLP